MASQVDFTDQGASFTEDLGMNIRKTQRPPKSCKPCRQRKIKCSLDVPCAQCVRRGVEADCKREIVRVKGRLINDDAPTSIPIEDARTLKLDNYALRQEVSKLEQQVAALTSQLEGMGVESLDKAKSAVGTYAGPSADPKDVLEDPKTDTTTGDEMGDRIDYLLKGLDFLSLGWDIPLKPGGGLGSSSTTDRAASPVIAFTADARGVLPTGLVHPTARDLLEELLPPRPIVESLLDWAHEWIWWRSCAYHIPSLREDMERWWARDGVGVDVNWGFASLLLAILSVATFYIEEQDAMRLSYSEDEVRSLSQTLTRATVDCLYRSNFLEEPSVVSVQTIVVLCDILHGQGLNSLHNCLMGLAVRQAQALNLHLLGQEQLCPLYLPSRVEESFGVSSMREPCPLHGVSEPHFECSPEVVQREISRRCWTVIIGTEYQSLVAREKHGIPHCGDSKPRNIDDVEVGEVAIVRPDTVHTGMSYLLAYRAQAFTFHQHLFAVMPDSHRLVNILEANTKLEEILQSFLQLEAAFQTPTFYPWAKHALTLTVHHRVMYLSRSLFARSFRRDPGLSLSGSQSSFVIVQVAGIQAAKAILKERSKNLPPRFDKTSGVMMATLTAALFLSIALYHTRANDPSVNDKRSDILKLLFALNTGPLQYDHFAKRASGLIMWLLNEEEDFRRIYEEGLTEDATMA